MPTLSKSKPTESGQKFIFPSLPPRPSCHDLATFWCVTTRTISNWRARGAPVENTEEMLAWIVGGKRVPRHIYRRGAEIIREVRLAESKAARRSETSPMAREG